MKIESFEDIKAWQEARTLAKMVYEAAKSSQDFDANRKFAEQLQNAAVSIMSNIAEGFSRSSINEFTRFLSMAQSSTAEVQSHLYVALDQGYINKETFNELYSKSDEVSVLITGFIQYLRNGKNGESHKKEGEAGDVQT